MDFKKLYRELVRRNVFRAVLAYLAVAWVFIEAASIILPTFDAPPELLKGLIYLLAFGLVVWTGFSWVYDLTPGGISKTPELADTGETRQLNSRRLNAVIVGAGVTALLVLLAGSFWAGSRWSSETSAKGDYRIAVLPFEDRSDNADFDYLREALAEDVISKLFNLSGVSIISSRSAFQFKDSEKSIGEISRELNADIVMIGNYSVYDQKVDVKVEVIDTREDEILNYASIVGNLGHIRDISSKIGAHLQESLGISEATSEDMEEREVKPVNPEAFKLYALGKSAMRDHTGQKLEDITRYFQAAIELDPEYIDPYIGMAEAYIFDVNRGYLSSAQGIHLAREYVLEAEKLNPGCGQVSGLLGTMHFFEFDFIGAIPYFENSLKKTPNFGMSYEYYSLLLEYLGDYEKAQELQKKAAALDPLNAMIDLYRILNYIYQHEFGEAEALIDTKLAVDPDHSGSLWLKGLNLAEQGRYQEAYDVLLKRKIGLETNFICGYVYAKIGQEERARAVLKHMLEQDYVPPSQLAILYCGLGENDLALKQVEEAYLVHDGYLKYVLSLSFTDPIKDDPRYLSIVSQLGIESAPSM